MQFFIAMQSRSHDQGEVMLRGRSRTHTIYGRPVQKSNSADIGQKRNAMPESVFLPLVRVLDDRHGAEPAGWGN